jgi:SOS-response transcriptional repressor LexA
MGFRRKIRSAGQLPSFGSIGDGLDNAMMKALVMQIERFDRHEWKTRVELAHRHIRPHQDLPQRTAPSVSHHD